MTTFSLLICPAWLIALLLKSHDHILIFNSSSMILLTNQNFRFCSSHVTLFSPRIFPAWSFVSITLTKRPSLCFVQLITLKYIMWFNSLLWFVISHILYAVHTRVLLANYCSLAWSFEPIRLRIKSIDLFLLSDSSIMLIITNRIKGILSPYSP